MKHGVPVVRLVAIGTGLGVGGLVAMLLTSMNITEAARAGEPFRKGASKSPREVTVIGTVVDVHGSMTGVYESADRVKCVEDCIRSGVPTALQTEDGLILLGHGTSGPSKMFVSLALREVEVRGKLYEKFGINYLDVSSARELEPADVEEDDSEGSDDEPDDPGTP